MDAERAPLRSVILSEAKDPRDAGAVRTLQDILPIPQGVAKMPSNDIVRMSRRGVLRFAQDDRNREYGCPI